jgi:hypothetical protein
VSEPSPPSPASPLRGRLPLVSLLAAVAFIELVLNRLLVRMLRLDPLSLTSGVRRLLDEASLFVFELVSVLSVLLLLAALVGIAVGKRYRWGARMAFAVIGGAAVVLSALGVVFRLPPLYLFNLHLAFLFLGLVVALTVASAPVGAGNKLGALFVFVAFALRLVPAMSSLYAPLLSDSASQEVLNAGFFAAVAAASLLMLPRGGSRLAAIVTWVAVCGAAILMRRDFDAAERFAAYLFDVDLPSALWGQALALLALGFALNTLVRLLSLPGPTRLRGWGLLLFGLGGLQLTLPYQIALASLGLLCLAEAAIRTERHSLSKEAFDSLVRSAAAAVGAPRVTVVGSAGAEIVRLHAPPRDGLALALTLRRRAGAIDDLEVVVGDTPPRDPPFTLERRGAGRLGARGEGERVEVGDRAFDEAFLVRDRRDVGARLLDDATRARLIATVRGWLAVWPRAGVRYHARELDPAELPALLQLLADLAKRAD